MTQPFVGMSLGEVLGDTISASSNMMAQDTFSGPYVAAANPGTNVVEQAVNFTQNGPAAGLSSLVLGNKAKPSMPTKG